MMKKYLLPIVVVLLVANTAIDWTLHYFPKKKVAFVRSEELISEFKGTLEIRNSFNEKAIAWQAYIDSLEGVYSETFQKIASQKDGMTEPEKEKALSLLKGLRNEIDSKIAQVEEQSATIENEMMQGILNQINSFVEQYAKSNDYTLILGTTRSGSILYGEELIDITDELIVALNEYY